MNDLRNTNIYICLWFFCSFIFIDISFVEIISYKLHVYIFFFLLLYMGQSTHKQVFSFHSSWWSLPPLSNSPYLVCFGVLIYQLCLLILFHIWVKSKGICLPLSVLFYLAKHPQILFMLLQMKGFIFFILNSIPLCVCIHTHTHTHIYTYFSPISWLF